MDTITLSVMNEAQFLSFVKNSNEAYACESPHYRHLPLEISLPLVEKEFYSETAPKGLQTPGQHFLAIMKGETQVGYLHLGERAAGSQSVFAWDFQIEKYFQRKGYGRAAMIEAQKYLISKGYLKVSLNVFADNANAISLYESFGFKVSQFTMERSLVITSFNLE